MIDRGASRSWQGKVIDALHARPDPLVAYGAVPRWSSISGAEATSVWSLALGALRFFVKVADGSRGFALAAEADGLHAIASTGAIRVPRVIVSGEIDSATFLVLEWLDIVDGGRDATLGRALEGLHAATSSRFGWHRDNTIGATLQVNTWADDWATFFRDRRLRPQLELARQKGYDRTLRRDGARLLEHVPRLLDGHRPAASLVHGDLWAGNAARLRDGSAVVYDPSTYYGDRETDLAMTELFGGFDTAFYAAYTAAMPMAAGYDRRRTLYNLYHILNHLNLFGTSYLRRAESMLAELLAYR